MDILNQCSESSIHDFKPLSMRYRKGRVVEQQAPVEQNRLIVSEIVTIDEPIIGYVEIMELRISSRGHQSALKKKICYGVLHRRNHQGQDDEPEGLWNTSLILNAHRNSGSTCEFTAEGSFLRHFYKEMRTTSRFQPPIAIPYVRTASLLRLSGSRRD